MVTHNRAAIDAQAGAQMLQAVLQPWFTAVEDPGRAQDEVLHRLLKDYARTGYGAQHGAANIGTIEDYRHAFPIATYADYRPIIEQVMAGDQGILLGDHSRHHKGRIEIHPHDPNRPEHARQRGKGHDELCSEHREVRPVRRG